MLQDFTVCYLCSRVINICWNVLLLIVHLAFSWQFLLKAAYSTVIAGTVPPERRQVKPLIGGQNANRFPGNFRLQLYLKSLGFVPMSSPPPASQSKLWLGGLISTWGNSISGQRGPYRVCWVRWDTASCYSIGVSPTDCSGMKLYWLSPAEKFSRGVSIGYQRFGVWIFLRFLLKESNKK